MLGFQPDAKVTIDARHWEALRRIVWRMKVAWGFVEQECLALVATCRHVDGCRGAVESTEPCRAECPDRQTRLSALVVLANAREFARADARKPGASYIPPTREYFDAIVSDLVAAEVALDEVRRKVVAATELVPALTEPAPPPALTDGPPATDGATAESATVLHPDDVSPDTEETSA